MINNIRHNERYVLYFLSGALLVLLALAGYQWYQQGQRSQPIAGFQATANGETFRVEVTEDGINATSEPAR